jgi:hypothetical protein
MDSVTKRRTYEKVNHLPSNTKVLPLRWVFAYKLDSSRKLERCKARIVVRGDLQPYDSLQDASATTLAARVFRALMAFTAALDLDTCQLDAVTAFLNAELDEIIYCQYPEGFKDEGYI